MYKISLSLLAIWAVVCVSTISPAYAHAAAPPAQAALEASEQKPSPDLKKAIAENNKRYDDRTSKVDVKELEKIERQTAQKKGWTGKQKLALAFVIAGIAAIVFFVVKYGKDCIRSEPAGCNPVTDEGCVCHEYEQG